MGFDGSPKKYAQDIANGLHNFTRATLKRYTFPELKKIMGGLQVVAKEIRSQAIPSGDYDGLKQKGMKTQRINSAMMVLRAWARENKAQL